MRKAAALVGAVMVLMASCETVKPAITVSLAHPPTTYVGDPVTFSGVVQPSRPGATVVMQRLIDGHWQNRSSATTDSASRFKILFHPTAAATYVLRARRAATGSDPALTSNSVSMVVKAVTVPAAPASVTAVAGVRSVKLTIVAPDPHGAEVTGYEIDWSGGGHHDVSGLHHKGGEHLTVTISGLAAGTPRTFTVRAVNRIGTGPAKTSNTVTPTA